MKASISPVSDIPFVQVKELAASGVAHGFFGRQGGISSGIYSSLNCGIGSSDNPDFVQANRTAVAKIIGADSKHVLSMYQVHGDTCLRVSEPYEGRPQADAQVTDVPGIALSVLSADCAPVLFYGEANGKPVIGAAHAGWKGAIGGVLDSTVYAMEEYGVKAKDIRAAIGPCIGKRSYEVKEEFAEAFIIDDPENEKFFMSAAKEGHLMFDLPGYCASRLYHCGVGKVTITGLDTFARESEYFSYRRTTHRKEADYGRQISVIVIK